MGFNKRRNEIEIKCKRKEKIGLIEEGRKMMVEERVEKIEKGEKDGIKIIEDKRGKINKNKLIEMEEREKGEFVEIVKKKDIEIMKMSIEVERKRKIKVEGSGIEKKDFMGIKMVEKKKIDIGIGKKVKKLRIVWIEENEIDDNNMFIIDMY